MYPISTSCGEIGKILNIILDNVLSYKNNGLFVEVGANDGKTGSFTYNLANIGWYGINFEPIPWLYDKCCDNYKNFKNIKNYQLAIGDEKGLCEITDGDTLSTMDSDTLNAYCNINQFKNNFINSKKYKVNVEKLDTMLDTCNVTIIDLLIIDVEGYEENVLKGFSIAKYKPSIIIIEICDNHPDFINKQDIMEKFKRLRSYFKNNNYSLLVNDIVDNVYIHNDIFNNLNENFITNIKKYINHTQYQCQ